MRYPQFVKPQTEDWLAGSAAFEIKLEDLSALAPLECE